MNNKETFYNNLNKKESCKAEKLRQEIKEEIFFNDGLSLI